MPIMRSVLLAISENRWMRAHGQRLWFVRRAVSAFMPGEELEDMLRAAGTQAPHNIGTVFTRLGESVTEWSEADFVMRHYLDAMERCRSAGVGSEPSVKLTQLGLDMDAERCHQNLRALAERARQLNSYLWIDMEQTAYVDATLEIVRRLQAEFGNVGVCLQAYLYRTLDDIAALRPLGVGVRLVKGAYSEPPALAFPRKADVDENFFQIAVAMLAPQGRPAAFRAVFGTHDAVLIARIRAHCKTIGVADSALEVHMLYGIQRAEQLRLVKAGVRVCVLIAYGTFWFPWYMRRLAERPANVGFVLRSMFAR